MKIKFKRKKKNPNEEGKYRKKNITSPTIKKQSFKNTSSTITDNEYEVTSEIDKETYK